MPLEQPRGIWRVWAAPWEAWRARVFAWLAATNWKRCPECGYRAESRGDPSLGPPICPRCGTRFEVPGR